MKQVKIDLLHSFITKALMHITLAFTFTSHPLPVVHFPTIATQCFCWLKEFILFCWCRLPTWLEAINCVWISIGYLVCIVFWADNSFLFVFTFLSGRIILSVLPVLKGLWVEGVFLMKINDPESLDLQKLHFHCIIVEYIKVMPAMRFSVLEISIYAY